MSSRPIPHPTPETKPFWDGCAAGELRLQHCQDCAQVQFPPRRLCSGCFSPNVEWRVASGAATVVSWSEVVRAGAPGFEDEVPFVSAFVRLQEGPMMLTVLREVDARNVHQNMPVEVTFEVRSDTISIPCFRPVPR